MSDKLKFIISRGDAFFGRQFSLRIGARINESVPWAVARPVQFEVMPDAVETLPCLTMSMDDMQALMDELWVAGIRPSEGTGSAGSLAATERHLADMRALVFKQEPK